MYRLEKEGLFMKYITTPTISEILREEFMEPLGISAYRLAQAINVPASRVQDILHGRRKITADTSLRLAKFFGVSDRYFLDLQNDIDIRNLKIQLANEISKIPVCQVG
jgi:addiction module HigA family antidote